MPRSISCSACGAHMWFDPKTRLAVDARKCRACRRVSPDYTHASCIDCGGRATGTRCRPCYATAKTIWPADSHQGRRKERERLPGLSRDARRRLLHRWQSQGRTCTYCPRPCDTIDHVIPLARGGTNYEGNLTPACGSCNSSKSARLLIEWRINRPFFLGSESQRTRQSFLPPRGARVA